MAQQRVVEPDGVADPKVVGGEKADGLAAADDLEGLEDLEVLPLHRQGSQARFVDEDHEGSSAAVEDRHLGAVHLHDGVVDAQSVKRRKEMLDGLDGGTVAGERGRVIETGEILQRRGDLDAAIDSAKQYATAGGCRLELEAHRLPRMQPDARTAHGALKRSSVAHSLEAPVPA